MCFKREDFIRTNRGINDGKDLPPEYLGELYDQIRNREIKMDPELLSLDGGAAAVADESAWNTLIRKSAMDQAPAAFTSFNAARSGSNGAPAVSNGGAASGGSGRGSRKVVRSKSGNEVGKLLRVDYDRDMFLVMGKSVSQSALWCYG